MRKVQGDRAWTKPPAGWVKINLDAACDFCAGIMSSGCVIRDECGNFLRARCAVLSSCLNPREAEALSLKEALTWTKEWRRSKCIFETDYKLLVDAVSGTSGKSYFHTIVTDCIELLKHFDEVLVVFVYRSANHVAHLLARASNSMSDHQEWTCTAPNFIDCTIAIEKA